MDALFDKIDVRDLLSSPDLLDSPSSPLAAPDLRLLVSRLESHSLHMKSKVQSYLLAHHDDFAALFSQCSDVVSKSDQLSALVFDLLRLISDHPVEADVAGIIKEIVDKRRETKVKRELLELVEVIGELNEQLRVVKEDIKNKKVVEAAGALRTLKEALGVNYDVLGTVKEVEGEPVAYGLLRKQWAGCFDEIQELLQRLMETAVRYEHENNKVHVKYMLTLDGVEHIELHTVMKAMDVAGILDYGFAKIADLFIKHVITPAVNSRPVPSFIEEIDHESEHVSEADLKMVPSTDLKTEAGETMYSTLIQIINFINKSLCFTSGPWMCCFGRLTWPRMSELIIANFLSKVVPDDASKLAEFQKIVKLTSEFETKLMELKFISPSDVKDKKLSKFADNVEVHFASRKKIEILAKARSLLLTANFNLHQDIRGANGLNKECADQTSNSHVVNMLFLSEKCVVSEAAKQLMDLVHQSLKDVCVLPPRAGLEFYHAARDALTLYEAIVPVKLEKQLDSINQAAVLIHNDCLYLSQEVLGLAFEYWPSFPSSLQNQAVFVDLAPRFQLMAEEVLQRQVHLVMHNLKQAIDGADGFQNTHLMKQYESAKFSIDQVSFIIEKVHIIWEPLLLPDIYERSMAMVVEAVFSRITRDVLLLDDMAEEETLQLQRLIGLLFEHLSSLLESLLAVDRRGNSEAAFRDIVGDFMPSLRKLHKLAELLDMPLKSITAAWESGELVSCNFTLSEVEDFIRAIFTDSPLRKECLFRIENMRYLEREYKERSTVSRT